MVVKVFNSQEELGQAAALVFASAVIRKPDCILGLATGTSPIPTYKFMSELNKKGLVDFSKVSTYNLDEYVGLTGDHVQSYRYFMNENLFNHINIDKNNTHVLNGMAEDTKAECENYDAEILQRGGIDVQILGIGHNGHIGFNEPDDYFTFETHKVELTESTIDANSRLFESKDEVPTSALSMGMGTIMNAKTIVMVVNGAGKAQAVYDMLKGPISAKCPASILQKHPDVTVFLDKEAASKL